jgi:hypothetical protein
MPSAPQSSTLLTGPQGIPSITPHLNLAANAASVASGGIAILPTFTADDARAWVMAHLLPAYQQAYGTMTISSVTFLPCEQASQRQDMGGNLNLPVGTPLCVVVLDGTFSYYIRPPESTPPATCSYSLGFNGVTGNLLFRSAPSPPPTPMN